MAYLQSTTLGLSIPNSYGSVTMDLGRDIATQIMEAISAAVAQNYRPSPPRFQGDLVEKFEPSQLKVINARHYSSDGYGREIPDFLKIQYDGRGNVCHIQLKPNGTTTEVQVELFGWPLHTETMQSAAAENIKKRRLALEKIMETA